jgi:hypothetical protein
MGRKNKIQKEQADIVEDDPYEKLEIENSILMNKKEELEYEQDNIILDIQKTMIEYVDELSIPLCEYLTTDLLKNFIVNLHINFNT